MPSAINSDNGVVSGTAGLKSSADSSGVLDLQTNGTTAISISASQVVSFANQPTYTGGTANGVMYLNGSKAVTTGTALTFDGSNLATSLAGATSLQMTSSGSQAYINLRSVAGGGFEPFIGFGDTSAGNIGQMIGVTGGGLRWTTGGSEQMRLNTTGLGIGTNSPAEKLHVNSGAGNVPALFESTDPIAVIQFKDNNSTLFNAVGVQTNSLIFYSGDTVNMRLDNSGRLLVGTTSSIGTATVGRLQVLGGETFVTTNSEAGGFVGVNANADNSLALVADVDNLRAGSHIAFYVDGFSEKMRLDSSGNLGIGITNPAYQLQISGGTTVATRIQLNRGSDDANQNLRLGWNAIKTTRLSTALSGVQTNLDFVQVGSDGERTCFSMGTNGSLEVNLGIKFPATQAASSDSNTLDDYEEGSWSPVLAGIGSGTINQQFGAYTKIGNLVFVTGKLGWTGKTGTDALSITGLPFNAADASDSASRSSCLPEGDWQNVNDLMDLNGMFRINGTSLQGVIDNGSGSSIIMTAANVSAAGEFNFSLTYRASA